MRRRRAAFGAGALGLLCACALLGHVRPAAGGDVPHFDANLQRVEYTGPGREDPDPEGLSEVRIGYFGPSDPADPEGGDVWLAAEFAVEEANLAGGYRGLPYRLVPAWSEDPWGTGVAQVTRLVYEDGVWAIIGSIDGATTHLAEQVVAKARLALVSPVSTDKTVNLANVPWMFSCLPADDAHAQVLSKAIVERLRGRPFGLVSATDHDSRVAAEEFAKSISRRGAAPLYHVEFSPGTEELDRLSGSILSSGGEAVVIFAGALEGARLLAALREADESLLIFGGPSMARSAFTRRAGAAADGVLFPLPCEFSYLESGFVETFRARHGRTPDCQATQAYDAVRLLTAAIDEVGLNRAKIRDSVGSMPPWPGAAGSVEWDSLGRNPREVRLATIREGRVVEASE